MKTVILAIFSLYCTVIFANPTDSVIVKKSKSDTVETIFKNLAKPDSQTNAVVTVYVKPIMQKAIEDRKSVV